MVTQGWPIPCRWMDLSTGQVYVSNLAMVIDIVIGVAILLAVAYACEWWIARQERARR